MCTGEGTVFEILCLIRKECLLLMLLLIIQMDNMQHNAPASTGTPQMTPRDQNCSEHTSTVQNILLEVPLLWFSRISKLIPVNSDGL